MEITETDKRKTCMKRLEETKEDLNRVGIKDWQEKPKLRKKVLAQWV